MSGFDAHYYENFLARRPFPIVVDIEDMLTGYDTLQTLASDISLVVPGHDPLVTELFPAYGDSGFVGGWIKGRQHNCRLVCCLSY